MTISDLNLLAVLPLLIVAGWASALLLVDVFIPKPRKAITGWLALVGLVVAFIALLSQAGQNEAALGGMAAVDGFAHVLNTIFLLTGALSVLMAINYLKQHNIEHGEFYPLLLFTITGMMTLAIAQDLIVVFLGIELLSIPLYVLAGIARPRLDSEESAMKYFLLGAFSSGFLVYGIALVFGATGSTAFDDIVSAAAHPGSLLLGGVGLVMVGLGFKVAAVPFHMWTPDVYQGAPSVVTAFMSVGAKAGGFAALFRVFFGAFGPLAAQWAPAIAVIAALTLFVGNIAAIAQTSIKRMLAYSSIAHAGYILMAAVAGGTEFAQFAAGAALFYLVAYAFTNLGTWAIVLAVEKQQGAGTDIADYAGLGKKRPELALAMALFMLSLTGLPPSMGFVGKFYVFRATLEAGYVWLAVVGVITSLISAYYYLRVIVVMWMHEGPGQAFTPRVLNFTVAVTAIATLVFGLAPGSFMALAEESIRGLF
ncbi:MAG: NADH-quinone oxidoreductase subunit N [Anaerolineales bacterium]